MNIEKIIIYLRELNFISILLRLSLAVIFGGIIGVGREREKRPAGLRTHILVCLGSTLAMLTNVYISNTLQEGVDPTRIGAQVISGIGFLGAGTILVTGKNRVKGLTTAAGLWSSACMGLAIGVGFYEGAVIGCIFIVSVTAILGKVDKMINKNSRRINLYIIISSPKILSIIISNLKKKESNIEINDVEINNHNLNCDELIGVLMTIKIPDKIPHEQVINLIESDEGVIFLQEIE